MTDESLLSCLRRLQYSQQSPPALLPSPSTCTLFKLGVDTCSLSLLPGRRPDHPDLPQPRRGVREGGPRALHGGATWRLHVARALPPGAGGGRGGTGRDGRMAAGAVLPAGGALHDRGCALRGGWRQVGLCSAISLLAVVDFLKRRCHLRILLFGTI
jgi:hypothetical protein